MKKKNSTFPFVVLLLIFVSAVIFEIILQPFYVKYFCATEFVADGEYFEIKLAQKEKEIKPSKRELIILEPSPFMFLVNYDKGNAYEGEIYIYASFSKFLEASSMVNIKNKFTGDNELIDYFVVSGGDKETLNSLNINRFHACRYEKKTNVINSSQNISSFLFDYQNNSDFFGYPAEPLYISVVLFQPNNNSITKPIYFKLQFRTGEKSIAFLPPSKKALKKSLVKNL